MTSESKLLSSEPNGPKAAGVVFDSTPFISEAPAANGQNVKLAAPAGKSVIIRPDPYQRLDKSWPLRLLQRSSNCGLPVPRRARSRLCALASFRVCCRVLLTRAQHTRGDLRSVTVFGNPIAKPRSFHVRLTTAVAVIRAPPIVDAAASRTLDANLHEKGASAFSTLLVRDCRKECRLAEALSADARQSWPCEAARAPPQTPSTFVKLGRWK